MEFNIEIEHRETYLYIHVQGTYNIRRTKELFRDAVDAATKHNLNVVLVDFREIEGDPPTTMERYDYANFMADVLREKRVKRGLPILRFAYVARVPFLDQPRFCETVAVNRGVIFKVTDDFEEALAWLLSKEKANEPL